MRYLGFFRGRCTLPRNYTRREILSHHSHPFFHFSQRIFGVCSRFLGNKTFMTRALDFFCDFQLVFFAHCADEFAKKSLTSSFLGETGHEPKFHVKHRSWKKIWGKQPIFSKYGKRGFKSLSLWGRSCWADTLVGRADTLVGQTRLLVSHACWADTLVGQTRLRGLR